MEESHQDAKMGARAASRGLEKLAVEPIGDADGLSTGDDFHISPKRWLSDSSSDTELDDQVLDLDLDGLQNYI